MTERVQKMTDIVNTFLPTKNVIYVISTMLLAFIWLNGKLDSLQKGIDGLRNEQGMISINNENRFQSLEGKLNILENEMWTRHDHKMYSLELQLANPELRKPKSE